MPSLRFLPLLLVAACASRDPMSVLPPADRAALLDGAGRDAAPGRLTVAEMLARSRSGAAPSPAPSPAPAMREVEPLVLRFAADAVQPDAAQRSAIEAFAVRAGGAGGVVVVAHRAAELAGGDALLGQRRAVAVARLLEPRIPEVATRFDPGAAPGEIVLLPATSLAR